MFCPTPPIILGDVLESQRPRDQTPPIPARLKRQIVATVNQEENIDVEIGFFLDGVPDYRNLTTTLPEYSSLTVYANPVIEGFAPPSYTVTFTSTWPVSEKYLEIKVKPIVCL